MNPKVLSYKLRTTSKRALGSAKWFVFSIVVGLLVGLVGTSFAMALSFVTILRGQNPWLIYLLPVGGLAIVALYHAFKNARDTGTNLVISAIHSDDNLPLRQAPSIYISTLITHLVGGSAGREGAALQIGGSIGNALGKFFRFDDKDRHVMIMCGMSAAFSAVFGTPMAAAVFSMEMVTVGVMHYAGLVPCVISALTAKGVAVYFGLGAETFEIIGMPAFTIRTAVEISILAGLAGAVSILFCEVMHTAEHTYKKYLKNPYLRVFVGGCILLILTLLIGGQTYNGSGMNIIEECFEGHVVPYAFLMKLLFTAICIGAGFKGGEIVPAFTVGASFGCLCANLAGMNPGLCSAVGLIAVFCGITNSPITSLLIAFEMFGYEGMPYFLLTIAISYMLSGNFGLYHTQKIIYSKYKMNYMYKDENEAH